MTVKHGGTSAWQTNDSTHVDRAWPVGLANRLHEARQTTLLNAVINEMVVHDPIERVCIIEDTGEIQCAATVAHLARGSWDVAKAKAAKTKEGAMSRIAETTGGKIAAAIGAHGATLKPDADDGHFGDDSLSEGNSPPDPEAEIAAFRDRQG
jgi:hypothetical protein